MRGNTSCYIPKWIFHHHHFKLFLHTHTHKKIIPKSKSGAESSPPTKIGKPKNCLTSFPFVNQSNQRMIMFLQMTSPLPGVVAGVLRAIMWWDCWWRLWLWLFWRSRLLVRKGFHVNRLPAVVERAWLLVPLSTVLSRSLFECRLKLKKSAARLSRPVMVRSRLRPPFFLNFEKTQKCSS